MKVYLSAPGQHTWPHVPDDVQERILRLIKEVLHDERLERPRKRRTTANPIRKHFAIGLREVTRCLKHKRCAAVFVCTSLTPLILSKPILLLAQLNSVPAFRLKHLSSTLTAIFALPHCSVFALNSSCEENEQLTTFLAALRELPDEKTTGPAKFVPGKILAPFQNPKRVAAGVQKKKKKKKK